MAGMDAVEQLLIDWLDKQDAGRDQPAWRDTRDFLAAYPAIDEKVISGACTRLAARGQIRLDPDPAGLLPSVVRVKGG